MIIEEHMPAAKIPNQAYDIEYATQFRKEVEYLKERGFKHTYRKCIGEHRIPTYKYMKTSALFRAIADFYEQQEYEREFNKMNTLISAVATVDSIVHGEDTPRPNRG